MTNPWDKIDISDDVLKRAMPLMVGMRSMEEQAAQLYMSGAIKGFCHTYTGQEAVAVGAALAKRPEDAMITGYRVHGFMYALNPDPTPVFGELMGKPNGCSKGKGGSMHMFDVERKMFGGHGIVGAQVALGTGLAFANKYNNNGAVSLTFMGDGAANQGQVYESFNMAKLWGLPVVYVIENNGYGMGTSVARAAAGDGLYKRGLGFDIEGFVVDGMDFCESYKAFAYAIQYCRQNETPILLEFRTYRYRGHSMSDPGLYRTKDEVTSYMKERDAINGLLAVMQARSLRTEEQLKKLTKEHRERAELSAKMCMEMPDPDLSEAFTDVYA